MLRSVSGNRWCVFAAAWIISFCVSGNQIVSVFANPLIKLQGWSLSEMVLVYSIYQLFFTICGLFAGRLADKYGPRTVAYVCGGLYSLGWFLSGFSTELWQYYLFFGVIAGGGGGGMYIPTVTSTMRWFPDKRGTIAGLMLAAASVGPVTMAPLATALIESYGPLNTYMIFGCAFVVVMFSMDWMLQQAPEGYRPTGWTPPAKAASQLADKDYTWQEMLRTPLFFALLIIFVCGASTGNMMVGSLAVIGQDQIGLTAMAAAMALSVSTGANFCGRLSFGVICDVLGTYQAILLSLLVTACGLLLLSNAAARPLFLVSVALLGFAFGGLPVIFPMLAGRAFGLKNLGVNYGILVFGYAGGAYIGPRLAGYYRESTGSFTNAYFVAAILALLGISITLFLILKERSRRKSEASGYAGQNAS